MRPTWMYGLGALLVGALVIVGLNATSLRLFPLAISNGIESIRVSWDEVPELRPQSDGKATVCVCLALQCPISNGAIPKLNRLCEKHRAAGIQFVGIVPGPRCDENEIAAHRERFGISFPVLADRDQRLVRALQATHTPQAVVVSAAGDVLYSGRIDDQYADLGRKKLAVREPDLRNALAAIAAGKPVAVARTRPIGCLIEEADAAEAGEVTWANDVAPILFERCAGCHRPGEAAPFSLLTYEDARAHAEQMLVVVERRVMPPWKAEPDFGHFQNERRLTHTEMQTLREWVAQGTPEGNPDDRPVPPQFAAGWQLGEPDIELEMPAEFEVPADGPDIYQHFVIPSQLYEDRLVSAIEFRPGNPEVVHHAIVYLDTTGEARRLDAADPAPGYSRLGSPGFPVSGRLGGWAPGGQPRRLPEGVGYLMPARCDVLLQVHYHPIGRKTHDRSRLGIYLAPATAQQPALDMLVANVDLKIPAGARRHYHKASYKTPVAITLLDATPHMHVL
ncbi:MAG TPA: redoxin domain-containing protein, partial [Planctomycetaceae bacterium]|nr:redoxin domain-containing protein [Planctomycetaceae bacterium]